MHPLSSGKGKLLPACSGRNPSVSLGPMGVPEDSFGWEAHGALSLATVHGGQRPNQDEKKTGRVLALQCPLGTHLLESAVWLAC
jgi:hypothetical protein